MSRPRELLRRQLVILAVASSALLSPLLALPSPASAETCPNEQLRAEAHSTTLPDCRAYELVTPPFKEAAVAPMETLSFVGGFTAMSADGSQVAVSSFGDPGDSNGAERVDIYDLTRTASGWTETNIDLPGSRFPAGTVPPDEAGGADYASEPVQAAPEFGKFLYSSPRGRAGDEHTNYGAYVDGPYWVGEAAGALHSLGSGEGEFLGASQDLSHVLFAGPGGLEEEDTSAGPPVPVSVDPSGNLCPAAKYSSPQGTGGTTDDYAGSGTGGMAADGSVVLFYIPAEGCSPGDPAIGGIFARVDESETVAISEPPTADCSACDTREVVGSEPTEPNIDATSADGSKVFFTTTQPLLGSETETSANIYEDELGCGQEQMSACAAASEQVKVKQVVHVTAGNWGPGGAQVQGGQTKVSADGSHVYFVAAGKLQGVKNNQGQEAVEHEPNLYVFDAETGATAFIATAQPNDEAVTPDGRFLVFSSSAEHLTPDDTSKTVQQAFEYDAQTSELVRVSIGQNGFNDNGNSETFGANLIQGEHGLQEHSGEFPRGEYMDPLAVSNDGAYVAFESSDGLTPGALNGQFEELLYEEEGHKAVKTYYAENVYEYHSTAGGPGGSIADGDVYLISDGEDTSFDLRSGEGSNGASAVRLRGMSPSGEDIFFETADRLVPQDLDTQVDLYDARIDGGFPAPVSLLPPCAGDACQGPLSPAPTLLSPGSELQAGEVPSLAPSVPAPAVKPKPKAKPGTCKKGYVKKKTKCVKKPKAASKAKKASRDRRTKS